ncbi:MAG: Uma2 family endonuclease [Gammaproteobacteria bacterium]|nr:Uma2 family endonuclease [Gammaproteobacteria bacterium]
MTSLVRHERASKPPPLAADGTPRLPHVAYDDEGYPHSDGAPLAQNTPQADQIFYAFPALKTILRERFPDAFVASDLLIYPRPRDLKASVAPDVFVAFGAGDHARLSYKLWEGEPVPAFVLEVLSGTTADKDLGEKRDKYADMGVREFWVFDPFGARIPDRVAGYQLHGRRYRPIPPLPGTRVVLSDVLGLEFREERGSLRIHDPATGEDLQSHREGQIDKLAAQRRATAEAERADAEAERANALAAENARLRRRLKRYESGQAS